VNYVIHLRGPSVLVGFEFNPSMLSSARMASPCIPKHYGAIPCSVVVPASHITAGHVYRGGRAAEIGYVVEGRGCSVPRLGCWYRRLQVRREKQEPGDSAAVVDASPRRAWFG
jgi:hypothetical protein